MVSENNLVEEKNKSILLQIAQGVWVLGMTLLLGFNFISYRRMKKSLSNATQISEHLYEVHNLPTPFVLGIFKHSIYIPSRLEEGIYHST